MSRIGYKLPKGKEEEIIRKAAEISKPKVDMLDCSISIARINTSATFEEVLGMELKTFYFIFRDMGFVGEEDYWDIGISTLTTPSYFVWIKLSPEEGNRLVKEYNLQKAL